MKTIREKALINDLSKQEFCSLWIFLSEAYKQLGNLQSAVRACKTVLEYKPSDITASLQVKVLFFILKKSIVNSTLSRNGSIQ